MCQIKHFSTMKIKKVYINITSRTNFTKCAKVGGILQERSKVYTSIRSRPDSIVRAKIGQKSGTECYRMCQNGQKYTLASL